MKKWNNSTLFLLLTCLVYLILTIINVNHVYFWDNIQQTSKEAHWFYQTNFSSLFIPINNTSEITATGYHPPMMGIMTALLWKIFGYKLWVSHIFILFWAPILFYNLWKFIKHIVPEKYVGWTFLLILIEPTFLSQYSIASPDFILITAFVIALRGLIEERKWLLAIGIFFLCTINMRGVFAGSIIYLSNIYKLSFNIPKKSSLKNIIHLSLPYLPTFIILTVYYTCYFYYNGWFFSNSAYSSHYLPPNGIVKIITHLAAFGLRNLENGRFIIWILGFYVLYKKWKSKSKISDEQKILFFNLLLITGLYLLFVFITQMPFSTRYFMPQFLILTTLTMSGIIKYANNKKLLFILLILIFEITGNFWIYPDKIAKSWDTTLAHLPFYELRSKCFEYIDQNKINYNDISGGFCIYGNQEFIDLENNGKRIGVEPNRKYFIYSNISNIDDSLYADLQIKNHWEPIKEFEKGFVNIILFKSSNK